MALEFINNKSYIFDSNFSQKRRKKLRDIQKFSLKLSAIIQTQSV